MATAYSPFLGFVTGSTDIETLKAFAQKQSWPETGIHSGDIRTATEFLASNPSPQVLLVEIPSAAEAAALLDGLANVCDPTTKVIVTGTINEYSFYCWLTEIGIFSYLLQPLTEQMLEGAYQKSIAAPVGAAKSEKKPGKIIAITGARGGVGASTLALNLAGLIAEHSGLRIALIDTDAQTGSIALALDIEPSRGLRDVLEKPERIDGLFMQRVMTKLGKNLSIMSAEESLHERLNVHDNSCSVLLGELQDAFDVIILDVSRHHNVFSRHCLAKSTQVIVVTEMTLFSLRDTLRLGDVLRDTLKLPAPIIVANRAGLAAKHEVPLADFEKGINAKVAYRIPFAPELFMAVGNDIPAVKNVGHAAMKGLRELAEQLVPEMKKAAVKGKKSSGFFSKKKKE